MMNPSYLTRNVFRRLSTNRPIIPRRHLHRHSRPRAIVQHGKSIIKKPQSRYLGFFSLFAKPPRDVRDPLLDPGMEKMLELDKRKHLIARLPPAPDLVKAWRDYFQSKEKRNMIVSDYHAFHLLQTLRTIVDYEAESKETYITYEDLKKAFSILARDGEKTDIHVQLAKLIFDALTQRTENIQRRALVKRYLKILCDAGHDTEARGFLEEWCTNKQTQAVEETDARAAPLDVWLPILKSFVSQSKAGDFWTTLEIMDRLFVDRSSQIVRRLELMMNLKANEVEKSKAGFESDVFIENPRESENSQLTHEILAFSLRNNEMQWALEILREAAVSRPKQVSTDLGGAALQAAAAAGKSVEDINNMLGVLLQSAQDGNIKRFVPDATLFNSLLKYAVERRDPYAAERFMGLLDKWNVEPNAETYTLQMEYRMIANDISGVKAAYEQLRDFEDRDDEDWNVLNTLVQSLCDSTHTDDEFLLRVVEDMSSRRKLFKAATVQSLCSFHLSRDEYFDCVDLLQTYAPQFSNAQRRGIRDILVRYTLDPETDTGRAWDTYMIFHQVFDAETDREIRNDVMTSFFERGRPDLATHVFTRMTKHPRQSIQPDAETYIRAFVGIAMHAEHASLEVVHNLLKLDTGVEPSTRLLNALMLAYDACGYHGRALQFWRDISLSEEGPSYNSLLIALRATEKQPFGYRMANSIWKQLQDSNVEISSALLTSYAASLSGNSHIDDAITILLQCEKFTGQKADPIMLGTVYNAANGANRQSNIERFIRAEFPGVFETFESQNGIVMTGMGLAEIQGISIRLDP